MNRYGDPYNEFDPRRQAFPFGDQRCHMEKTSKEEISKCVDQIMEMFAGSILESDPNEFPLMEIQAPSVFNALHKLGAGNEDYATSVQLYVSACRETDYQKKIDEEGEAYQSCLATLENLKNPLREYIWRSSTIFLPLRDPHINIANMVQLEITKCGDEIKSNLAVLLQIFFPNEHMKMSNQARIAINAIQTLGIATRHFEHQVWDYINACQILDDKQQREGRQGKVEAEEAAVEEKKNHLKPYVGPSNFRRQ